MGSTPILFRQLHAPSPLTAARVGVETMDTGAAFDLRINKLFAVMTIAGSLFLTALTWYFLMGVGK